MKNIVKHIGNIAVIVLGLSAALIITTLLVSLVSCKSNAQTTQNAIIFEFSNVDSCAYLDDSCFLIWYDDADAFDYDAMADRVGRDEWYGEFIYLDIEDSLVKEFLADYHKYIRLSHGNYQENWTAMDELSEHWGIVRWSEEHECYELVRIHEKGWWFK